MTLILFICCIKKTVQGRKGSLSTIFDNAVTSSYASNVLTYLCLLLSHNCNITTLLMWDLQLGENTKPNQVLKPARLLLERREQQQHAFLSIVLSR